MDRKLIGRLGALALGTALATVASVPVVAQESPDCCFANPRYGGTCAVTPAAGETCTSILAYLNGLSTAGKGYCSSTDIRGGWTQVECSAGGTVAGPRQFIMARPGEVYSAPAWSQSQTVKPSPGLEPLVVKPGSVIQVSLADEVDLAQAPPGTSFAARLDADLVVDGAVSAPSGSPVFGRVVSAQGRQQPVLELTDIALDGRLVPVVADATTQAPVGLPVAAGSGLPGKGQRVTVEPAVALFLTGDVAGAMDLTRATIQVRRQEIVAANLGLDEADGAAFWPLYREYREELDALGARDAAVIAEFARTFDSLGDGDARELLDEATAVEGERAKLREKYVKRFAKVLPGVKLARFFQIESKLDAVIRMELAAGIPLAR